jgi:hypothetical protein
MQKWEYLFLSCAVPAGHRLLKVHSVNGQVLNNWEDGPFCPEYVQLRGEQGWELAAYSEDVDRYVTIVLKRPKP